MFGKAIVMLGLALSAVSSAYACNLNSYREDGSDVDRVISDYGWDINNYAVVCNKLNQANASLRVDGMAAVLDGRAVSWAAVTLRDTDLDVYADSFGGTSIFVNLDPPGWTQQHEFFFWLLTMR